MLDILMRKILRPLWKLLTLDSLRNPAPKVAVIPLKGIIGNLGKWRNKGLVIDEMGATIEAAFNCFGVKAVALAINSPGGSPVQSAFIYEAILHHADKKDIPVYTFAEDVCASGGYWLACAGDEIYAHPASIVGSIGVVSAGFGFPEFIDRHGIERRVYTQGENKSMLDPFQPEKQEDIDRLLSVQRDVHESFKDLVISRRQKRLNADADELFSGAFWSGKQAMDMGLVDGLGSVQQVMREKFGENVKLVQFTPKKGLAGLFSSKMNLGGVHWTQSLISAVEERLHWQRFGQ